MKKIYLTFLKSIVYMLLICMIAGLSPKTSFAQQNNNLFIEVGFMKVKPGEGRNYVELEKKIWKPIHQERINQGKLVGWILYRVMYTGSDDAYNYATVNVYANRANLENKYQGIDSKKIHPEVDIQKEREKMLNTRKLVKVQLMSRANYAYPEGGEIPAPYKYIVVNYMKTLPGGNFMQLEDELAKPVSQQLVKNGDWAGWSVWSNVFPRGASMESNVVTVDYYPEFSNVGTANYRDAFEKAHPGKDWSEFTQKVGNSRTMVRSELWKVIDSAFAEQ